MGTRNPWTCWQGTMHWNAELPRKYVGTLYNKTYNYYYWSIVIDCTVWVQLNNADEQNGGFVWQFHSRRWSWRLLIQRRYERDVNSAPAAETGALDAVFVTVTSTSGWITLDRITHIAAMMLIRQPDSRRALMRARRRLEYDGESMPPPPPPPPAARASRARPDPHRCRFA